MPEVGLPSSKDVSGSFTEIKPDSHLAVGQNQWYHFGVGAPPILVYFTGDWDVHSGVRDFDPQPFSCGERTPFESQLARLRSPFPDQ